MGSVLEGGNGSVEVAGPNGQERSAKGQKSLCDGRGWAGQHGRDVLRRGEGVARGEEESFFTRNAFRCGPATAQREQPSRNDHDK